jgi:hypothetical protein
MGFESKAGAQEMLLALRARLAINGSREPNSITSSARSSNVAGYRCQMNL